MSCSNHHICECLEEKMKKLETIAIAAFALSNPAMSGWVKDFSTAIEQARQAKDPRPLIEFHERIKKDVTK